MSVPGAQSSRLARRSECRSEGPRWGTECLDRAEGSKGMTTVRCTSRAALGAHLADVKGVERLLLGAAADSRPFPNSLMFSASLTLHLQA